MTQGKVPLAIPGIEDQGFKRDEDTLVEPEFEEAIGDWREAPAVRAAFQAAYLQERQRVEELNGPWYANEHIGTKAIQRIQENPYWRMVTPEPDVGFLKTLPERELTEAAYLFQDEGFLASSIGQRPYAPYADKTIIPRSLDLGAKSFSIPTSALLQYVAGEERFDWPPELLQEVGLLRDQAIFEASHFEAIQSACGQALVAAKASVGIPSGQFVMEQDLPVFSPEYKAAVDAEKDLSDRYLQDIRDLVARYTEAEEDDSDSG